MRFSFRLLRLVGVELLLVVQATCQPGYLSTGLKPLTYYISRCLKYTSHNGPFLTPNFFCTTTPRSNLIEWFSIKKIRAIIYLRCCLQEKMAAYEPEYVSSHQ